jgi:hypothetical protein
MDIDTEIWNRNQKSYGRNHRVRKEPIVMSYTAIEKGEGNRIILLQAPLLEYFLGAPIV